VPDFERTLKFITSLPMPKFKAILEYDGAAYHGWQLQKDASTVQGAVEASLQRILGAAVRVYGAGRTDAGVHAEGQTIHFTAEWPHESEKLLRGLNALLPEDVVALSLELASEDFHARHSAKTKTYRYQILCRAIRSGLGRGTAWHVPWPLDVAAMNEAASFLMGTHDFAAFGRPTDGTPSTVRSIISAEWAFDADSAMAVFTITGSGFLRRMVRSVVGSLVEVGTGKVAPAHIAATLESRDRSKAGKTAPAHGLFLQEVFY
jgi:tRNA pseudouridine38-40 synthase